MYAPNAFEISLCALMQQNLKLWANAQPSIQPLDLLHAAVTVWNAHHGSSATKTYNPFDANDWNRFNSYQLRGTPWPLASLPPGNYGPAEQGINYPRSGRPADHGEPRGRQLTRGVDPRPGPAPRRLPARPRALRSRWLEFQPLHKCGGCYLRARNASGHWSCIQ